MQTFTCSKSTTETLEKTVNMFTLTMTTPKRRHWCRSGIVIVKFEHVSHLFYL